MRQHAPCEREADDAGADHRDGEVVTAVRLPALVRSLRRGTSETGRAFRLTKAQCLFEYFPHLNTIVARRELLPCDQPPFVDP